MLGGLDRPKPTPRDLLANVWLASHLVRDRLDEPGEALRRLGEAPLKGDRRRARPECHLGQRDQHDAECHAG
jgi:hypothetical protein